MKIHYTIPGHNKKTTVVPNYHQVFELLTKPVTFPPSPHDPPPKYLVQSQQRLLACVGKKTLQSKPLNVMTQVQLCKRGRGEGAGGVIISLKQG